MQRAHTDQLDRTRASRPGHISVGFRGAAAQGKRMRREYPNDRRPTRSASAGRRTCAITGRRHDAPTCPPRRNRRLTARNRSASQPSARLRQSAAEVHAAAATARSQPASTAGVVGDRRRGFRRFARMETWSTTVGANGQVTAANGRAPEADHRLAATFHGSRARRRRQPNCRSASPRAGHRLRQQSGRWFASHRSATRDQHHGQAAAAAAVKPAQQRGDRNRPERVEGRQAEGRPSRAADRRRDSAKDMRRRPGGNRRRRRRSVAAASRVRSHPTEAASRSISMPTPSNVAVAASATAGRSAAT